MVKMKLFSDSSSALGTIQKSGVGRMKHIEFRHLYLQEFLRRKVISVEKINTKQNPADLDLGTKKLAIERRRELFKLIGIFQSDHETQASRIESQQTRRVHSMLFRAFQAATVSVFQGCSSTDELDPAGESPTWTRSTRLMCMAYFVLALAVVYVVMAMVPRRGQGISSSSTKTRPPVPEAQDGQQRTEKRRVLGIMFLMAAKEYHYNREDRHVVHKTYYQIMLSVTLLMEGYYNVVDQFLSTIGTVENPSREKVFAEMSRMEEIVRLPFTTRNQYERWLYNHFHDVAEDMCREDSDMFLRIVDLLRLYHEGNESSEEETEEGEGSPATDDPSDHDSGDGNGEGENQKARSRSPRTGDQGEKC
jgi:hypothetical protein